MSDKFVIFKFTFLYVYICMLKLLLKYVSHSALSYLHVYDPAQDKGL